MKAAIEESPAPVAAADGESGVPLAPETEPQRPGGRRSWARTALEGAGAAILLMPGLLWEQLSPGHTNLYHRLLPLTTVARALAIDLVLLSLAGLGVILMLETVSQRAEGSGNPKRQRIAAVLWAIWLSLLAARGVEGLQRAQILVWEFVSAGWVFGALLLVLAGLHARLYRRTLWASRGLLASLGVCTLWIVPSLMGSGLHRQPRDTASFEKPLALAQPGHRRIVWLLFDGMSYDQVFDHRWPGLAMPNFDRLRSQSVTFSAMRPDGRFTEDVVPSLFLGTPIREVRATPDGWLLYRSHRPSAWTRFDGKNSLFADAHRAGWSTGIAGWYNPYCRLLRDQLDFCWMDLLPLPDHFSRDKTTLQNMLSLLPAPDPGEVSAQESRSGPAGVDEIAEVRVAEKLIADTGIDLCFVHLPLPHPPGHYNRRTRQIEQGGSYIDNLALSDRILRRMLADVAKTRTAAQTTVIVSSDHSWRVWLWHDTFGWTREDELAAEGKGFDARPVLMVRFPGETTATEVRRPVPLLSMHDLMEKVIGGEIESSSQLQRWAWQQ